MKVKGPIMYEYYFKGSRNYVHGTTMFESFCNILREMNISTFEVKDIKFHRELYNNGKIFINTQLTERKDIDLKDLKASMSIITEEKPINIYLFANQDSKVLKRRDDNTHLYIKRIIKNNDYESKSKLINVKDFIALITALVEVNKQTHIKTINDIKKEYKYRWVFSKNFFVNLNLGFPEEIEVKNNHLGHKKDKEGKIFTSNRIDYLLGKKRYGINMYFTYFKK